MIAAKTAMTATFRKARVAVASAEWAIDRAEWVIFPSLVYAVGGVDEYVERPGFTVQRCQAVQALP